MRTPHYSSLDEDPFSMFLPPRPWFVLERPNFSFFPNRSPFDIMPPMGDMGFDLGSIFNRRPLNKAPEGFVKVNETITEGNGGLRIKHTIWEKKSDGPNKMHAIIETTEVISPKEGDETSEEDKKENDRRSAEESNVERENEKSDESDEKKDIEENKKSEESDKKESEEKSDKEETSESKVNEKEEESDDKKPEENKEDKSIEKKNESDESEKSTEATPEKDDRVKNEEEKKPTILDSTETTPKPAENEITDKIETPSTPEVTIKDN